VDRITEKTWVPLSVVASALLLVVGFVRWLSAIHSDVQNLKERFIDNSQKIADISKKLDVVADIKIDVEVIKVKVQGITRPVTTTSTDLKAVKDMIQRGTGARWTNSFACPEMQGPFSMIERGE
jgi:hypothetical protein